MKIDEWLRTKRTTKVDEDAFENELKWLPLVAPYIEKIREWHDKEHAAGHPSGIQDFLGAHNTCMTCYGPGALSTDKGRHGDPVASLMVCPTRGGDGHWHEPLPLMKK